MENNSGMFSSKKYLGWHWGE